MKSRPIIFSGPMVRAILDGRKTQTRRVVKPTRKPGFGLVPAATIAETHQEFWDLCPYGTAGDELWVREGAWFDTRVCVPSYGTRCFFEDSRDVRCELQEDTKRSPFIESAAVLNMNTSLRKRPSILMPRWASRITLMITNVRVERLNEISAEDARAEGIDIPRCDCEPCSQTSRICTADQGEYVAAFKTLWESINGKDSWSANPWVWVVGFQRKAGAQ